MGKAVYIHATSAFFPNRPVGNDTIERVLGMVAGRPSRARSIVLESNRIQTRHYAIDPETRKPTHTNATLTASAIRRLLDENPGISLKNIDVLACGTSSPDHIMPAHGQMVQGEFAELEAEVFTTSGVCCSSMSAFKAAYLSLLAGDARTALVTGSEIASKFLRSEFYEPENDSKVAELKANPMVAFENDFLRWMLSDGVGALYLSNQQERSSHDMNTRPVLRINWIEGRSYANEQPVCMMAGGYHEKDGRTTPWTDLRLDNSPEGEKKRRHAMSPWQDIRLLREKITHYTIEKPLQVLRKKRGLHPGDYRWFLPHYSSHYFRGEVTKTLEKIDFQIPEDRWFTALYERGNIGSASMFVFIDELLRTKKLEKGEKILCFIPESARFAAYYVELEVM